MREQAIILPFRWILIQCMLVIGLTQCLGQDTVFPASWQGEWQGELQIYRQNQMIQQLPMEMTIAPLGSKRWTYETVYDREGNEVRKSYELIEIDASSGAYRIDEKNGIVLDAQFQNGCLYSKFEVMGAILQTRMCMIGDGLEYEITSGPAEIYRTTGDTIMGSDTIPAVQVYAVPMVQRAKLIRLE